MRHSYIKVALHAADKGGAREQSPRTYLRGTTLQRVAAGCSALGLYRAKHRGQLPAAAHVQERRIGRATHARDALHRASCVRAARQASTRISLRHLCVRTIAAPPCAAARSASWPCHRGCSRNANYGRADGKTGGGRYSVVPQASRVSPSGSYCSCLLLPPPTVRSLTVNGYGEVEIC